MLQRLRILAPVAVTAVVVSALTATGPAIAQSVYDAMNADTVDGKHAVSASAGSLTRAGKLVATNSSGLLPNNIISKARDADKLDGIDSTGFIKGTGSTKGLMFDLLPSASHQEPVTDDGGFGGYLT